MNKNKYYLQLGATTVYTKGIMEATKGIGQRYTKVTNKDCFIFDSWFSSNKLAESLMDVGADMIVMVKINTKIFCKETIDNLTKDWTGESYLVLRINPMVPGAGH